MKKLIFITKHPDKYNNIVKQIHENESSYIEINFITKENLELASNCIYVYEVNNIQDLELINSNYPFIVISNTLDTSIAVKCYKYGVLDCLLNPKNETSIYTKIRRFLLDYENIITELNQMPENISLSFYDIINRDIKGAYRGKYDYSLIGVYVNKSNEEDVKQFIKLHSRETDTTMIYGSNIVMVSMPFCDKEGSMIVRERLKASLKEKFKISHKFCTATLGIEGRNKEEIVNFVLTNLSINEKGIEEVAISI